RVPLRYRCGRWPFRTGSPRGRPATGVRQGDVAPPPRPRHADRAVVSGDQHPCRPPLSSGRLRGVKQAFRSFAAPLSIALAIALAIGGVLATGAYGARASISGGPAATQAA